MNMMFAYQLLPLFSFYPYKQTNINKTDFMDYSAVVKTIFLRRSGRQQLIQTHNLASLFVK
jgi:hypothetical protein